MSMCFDDLDSVIFSFICAKSYFAVFGGEDFGPDSVVSFLRCCKVGLPAASGFFLLEDTVTYDRKTYVAAFWHTKGRATFSLTSCAGVQTRAEIEEAAARIVYK